MTVVDVSAHEFQATPQAFNFISIAPCSGVLLGKLLASQLVKKFLEFYGTW
jgi:hypothetical protein